jgi:hypothetical protein
MSRCTSSIWWLREKEHLVQEELTEENEAVGKILPQRNSLQQNATWISLGTNSGHLGENRANNHLQCSRDISTTIRTNIPEILRIFLSHLADFDNIWTSFKEKTAVQIYSETAEWNGAMLCENQHTVRETETAIFGWISSHSRINIIFLIINISEM